MKPPQTELRPNGAAGESRVHLVVRVPRVTRVNGISVDTVKAHNDSLAARGSVSVAKFGNPGTSVRRDQLLTQIDNGLEAHLILVTKTGGKFCGYKSRMRAVHYGKAGNNILAGAPPYYRDLEEQAKLWFTVTDPFEPTNLDQFSLASNMRPLLEVMRECRTASLLVEQNG
jgi:hypothetical protein